MLKPPSAARTISRRISTLRASSPANNSGNPPPIITASHLGKLVKIAAGIFHTHNRVADGRLETLAAFSAAEGLPSAEVQKILDAPTTEVAAQIINDNHLERVYKKLAARASLRATRYVFGKLNVKTILVDFAGNILGSD